MTLLLSMPGGIEMLIVILVLLVLVVSIFGRNFFRFKK